MSAGEIYFLPRAFQTLPSHAIAALISKDDDFSDWRFLEVVELNSGIDIRFFREEQEALNWLEGKYNA